MKQSLIVFTMLCFIMVSALNSIAQVTDSSNRVLSDRIAQQMETIAESLDATLDFSDLIDSYYYYAENKINLNSPQVTELRNLYLINDFQLNQLQQYQKTYGRITSVYELAMMEGFDEQTLAVILPVVDVLDAEPPKIKPKNVLRYGRHQLLMRMERNLNEQTGYQNIEDSVLWSKPNARYLGTKEKLYAKYTFNYRDKVRAGLTMDKDAGEVFLKQTVNDSLQTLLGEKLKSGFDFYSAHAWIADIGVLKRLALGDYHLSFGQGLTMWSGLSFGKSTTPTQVMRYASGVKPNTSVNESFFLRGAAATFEWKGIALSTFYSNKKIDANLETDNDSGENDYYVTSLQESGLHRTVNELLDKGVIKQELIGGHISYQGKRFEIGYTAHQTTLESKLLPREELYSMFRFRSDKLFNQGIHWKWVNPHWVFFGEVAQSDNAGKAGIAGLQLQPAGFLSLTLAYRHYDRTYQNLFSNAFSESNATNNESGLYAGITAALAPRWKISAYADQFRFDWLRFSTDAPSQGFDYFLQSDYRISRHADMYFRFRIKQKMTNDRDPWNAIDFVVPERRNTWRFHINYRISPSIMLKNRAELITYRLHNQDIETGFLIYQDVVYRPEEMPYEFSFRFAMFDSESYDARLYAYESDVLYAFSIPSFSGKGSRVYLVAKYSITDNLDLQARISNTWYANKSEIGSGLELIEGSAKTDLKVQLRWKF